LVVIITKARMFPASNSTLYYEQARQQLTALTQNRVFDVPMRLVGLFAPVGTQIPMRFTEYHNPRYSRIVIQRTDKQGIITLASAERGRGKLRILDVTT
jgi:hypothetical protein